MSSYVDATGLVFSDGTKNYTATPYAPAPLDATGLKNVDFTGIPSWARRITVTFDNLSLTGGTGTIGLILGDSGGFETGSYSGSETDATTGGFTSTLFTGGSAGFVLNITGALTQTFSGVATLALIDTLDTWVLTFVAGDTNSAGLNLSAGVKSLTSTLTQVRIQAFESGATFDTGEIGLFFE